MLKNLNKKVNRAYGYRIKRYIKSLERFDFVQPILLNNKNLSINNKRNCSKSYQFFFSGLSKDDIANSIATLQMVN